MLVHRAAVNPRKALLALPLQYSNDNNKPSQNTGDEGAAVERQRGDAARQARPGSWLSVVRVPHG
jgi:hypothetical protein